MSRLNAPVVAFVAFCFAVACNQGEFAGGGSKKAAVESKKNNKPDNADKSDVGPDKDADLGNPSKDDDETPGNNSADSKGQTDGDNVNDLLNGLLGDGGEDAGTAVSPDEVVYGGNKVFHIGDSRMDGSSCNSIIAALSTAGRRYYFEFQVKEADTSVTISVNRICGVDYGDSNILAVAHSGTYIQEQKLVKEATNATITASNLAPGRYAVAIESRVSAESTGEAKAANDVDDYLVGEVRIKATRPITPGKAGAK